MYDLNVKFRVGKERELDALLKRLFVLGWEHAAITTQVLGRVGKTTPHIKPPPLDTLGIKSIEPKSQKYRHLSEICLKSNDQNMTSASSSGSKLRLLSRLNITIDDVNDAQSLTAQNETLQRFDIISVTPGNAQVFTSLCRSADIDIISLDFTHKISFPLNKKLIDEAVKRGVVFEILYSAIVSSTSSSIRREIYAGTRVLLQYLYGQSVLISSGADTYPHARGPLDVAAVAESLGLTREQAIRSIAETPARLVKRAAERRARVGLPQALSMSEILRQYPEVARRHRQSGNFSATIDSVKTTTGSQKVDTQDGVQMNIDSKDMVKEDSEMQYDDDDNDDDNDDDDDDDDGFIQFNTGSSSCSRLKEIDEEIESKQTISPNLSHHINSSVDIKSSRKHELIKPLNEGNHSVKKMKLSNNNSSPNFSNKQPYKLSYNGDTHPSTVSNNKNGHFSSLYKQKFDSQKMKSNKN